MFSHIWGQIRHFSFKPMFFHTSKNNVLNCLKQKFIFPGVSNIFLIICNFQYRNRIWDRLDAWSKCPPKSGSECKESLHDMPMKWVQLHAHLNMYKCLLINELYEKAYLLVILPWYSNDETIGTHLKQRNRINCRLVVCEQKRW